MALPGEVVTVFTYPYLSAGAPALGEAKGLIIINYLKLLLCTKKFKYLFLLKRFSIF